jgi:hypothetical protein
MFAHASYPTKAPTLSIGLPFRHGPNEVARSASCAAQTPEFHPSPETKADAGGIVVGGTVVGGTVVVGGGVVAGTVVVGGADVGGTVVGAAVVGLSVTGGSVVSGCWLM